MKLDPQTYEAYHLIPDEVFIYDASGTFCFVNQAGQQLLNSYAGIPIEGFFSFFQKNPEDIHLLHEKLLREQSASSIERYDTRFDADSSHIRYVSLSTRLLDAGKNPPLFLSVVRVSSFKTANTLEQKVFTEKYERLLESTPAMIWVTNIENRPIYSNNALRNFLGLDLSLIPTQREFESLIYPEDHAIAIENFNRAIQHQQNFRGEFRIKTADGTFKWVLEEASPLFDNSGQYMGYQGKFTNIHNVKLLQESLHKTQREIALLTEEGGFFVFQYYLDGTIREVSESCINILGYRPEQLEHLPLKEIVHPDDFAENFEPSMLYRYLKKYQTLLIRILTAAHQYKWIEIQGTFIQDEQGDVTGIICLARDVSDRLQLAEKMELSNRFLESTQSMIVITDKNQRIEWVNPSFTRITGFTMEEVVGRKPSEFLQGPGTLPATKSYMREKLQAGEPFDCELLNYNKQGRPYWVYFRCEPIKNAQGVVDKYFAIEDDITDRKTKEAQIHLAATFPSFNPNPILRIDREGTIIFKNPSAADLKAISFEQNEYTLPSFCSHLARTVQEKMVLHEVEVDQRIFEFTCIPIADTEFINIYGNDITELSRATLQLKNNERKYRYLAENSRDLICLHNPDEQIVYISPSSERLIEYLPEELYGSSLAMICHPEDAVVFRKHFQSIRDHQKELITTEVRLRKKSGLYQWFELQLYPAREQGQITGVQSSARDITQLKFQEFRLKVNELKYRRLIDNIDLGYVEMDEKGYITYANESFCRLTKYELAELVGQNPDEWLFPVREQQDEMRSRNEQRLKGIAEVYQIPIRRKDGVTRTLLISGAPLYSDEGMIVGSAAIHWDISPMLEMEELLHNKEVQRQRSILQASIRTEEKQKQTLGRELHDGLGQLLAYISLNMQLLLDQQTGAEEIVRTTKELINKAIAEVRQLSRTLIPVSLDNTRSLKDIINESLALFANMKGVRFELEEYREEVDRRLNVDQKHIIFRIIQELTNNTIKYAEASLIQVRIQSTARNCLLTYTDNGRGFQPKKVKKGVGFESIQNRVESYNGKLSLQSAPGKGMKVTVTIPYSKAATAITRTAS